MQPVTDHEVIENSPENRTYYDNKGMFYRNVFWLVFGNMVVLFGLSTSNVLMLTRMPSLGLDASTISLIMAIGQWVGIPIYLYFSYLTDNWQWKWGRRLPFVAFSMPIMIISLLFFPYTHSAVLGCGLYLLYQISLQVKATTYNLLTNDTCKKKYWGRVSGMILLLGYVGVWLSQTRLMPLVDSKGEQFVFIIIALIVAVATTLTLVFVREPSIRSSEQPHFLPSRVIWSTLKFGFGNKKHIQIFIAYALCAGGSTIPLYMIALQGKINLGLSDGEIGKSILQYGTIALASVAFLTGWLVDKIGVIKVVGVGLVFMLFAVVLGVEPGNTAKLVTSFSALNVSPGVILGIAYAMTCVAYNQISVASLIFVMGSVSREEIARFCACSGSVNLFVQAIGMFITGKVITYWFNGNYGASFIISIIFSFCGFILFYFITRSNNKIADNKIACSLEQVTG